MQRISEAQEALHAFDAATWDHPAGPETIRHIGEHLRKSISGALRNHRRFAEEMPAVCIEHALRLANACRCTMRDTILADLNEEPLVTEEVENYWMRQWICECWRSSRIAGSSMRESFNRLFVEFSASIHNLDVACEQAGHGRMPATVILMDAACQLMRYAVVFGPVGARAYSRTSLLKEPRAADQLVAEFLAPFALRLEELSQRFGYARA